MPVEPSLKNQEARHPSNVVKRRILVVDDSRLQRKILSSSLARWGYEVIEAGTGEEAVEVCHAQAPEIIISDWIMPGMTGIDFCKIFREMTESEYGYFILLTSKSEKNDVAEGLGAGADDFLTKPVNGNELRARITAGERILDMQRELTRKNEVIGETLDELQRLYDALDKDLQEAKRLQESLIPETFRTFGQSDLSLLLRSSGHVGGDLVGCYSAGHGHLGLYALDVSGHGISSALMTARLAGYLSSSAPDQNVALEKGADGQFRARHVGEAIETLNELVLDEMETEHYFTLVLANVDLQSGLVKIGQAGHPHPIVQRASGVIEQGGTGGFPVGLMSGVDFGVCDVQLNPGDRLILLSDGVTECPNPQGELLGETGIEEMTRKLQCASGPEFFEGLLWKLAEFAGTGSFVDDVSGVVFQYHADRRPM
ncbi:MAG: SpoIIE family protein phosphatase [Pseudomonadota bacterium]